MDIWKRILFLFGIRAGAGERVFELDERLQTKLVKLAEQENQDVNSLQSELLASAIENRYKREELQQRWESLSVRERQVSALTCLGYTNRPIAARLSISPETVKVHVRNALLKLNLHGKGELEQRIYGLGFFGMGIADIFAAFMVLRIATIS